MVCVILAGGGGKRLWPLSTPQKPKFLLKIGKSSLLEMALKRARKLSKKVYVICTRKNLKSVLSKVRGRADIIVEPMAKNTAPAICLASLRIKKELGNEIILVMPSDHIIEGDGFFEIVKRAEKLAEENIVTFGIKPTYPETGYGYILLGEKISDGFFKVERFIEKPPYTVAEELIASKKAFWNSGIFLFSTEKILEEIDKNSQIYKLISEKGTKAYEEIEEISIDYLVMEKCKNIIVGISDFFWSDVGSFKSIKDYFGKDNFGNADFISSSNNLFLSEEKLNKKVVFFGVENIVLVNTKKYILITNLQNSQKVKDIAEMYIKNEKKNKRKEKQRKKKNK